MLPGEAPCLRKGVGDFWGALYTSKAPALSMERCFLNIVWDKMVPYSNYLEGEQPGCKVCRALGVARVSSGKRAGQWGEPWSEKNHPHAGTCACCATQTGAHEHNISSTSPAWQGSAPPSPQHRGIQAGKMGSRAPLPSITFPFQHRLLQPCCWGCFTVSACHRVVEARTGLVWGEQSCGKCVSQGQAGQ